MSKHIIRGYIVYEKTKYQQKPKIDFDTFRPDKSYRADAVVVREHSFEVDVPDDFDPRPELIRCLKEQEKKLRADFEMRITEIKRQISEYEAIEHEVKPS